MSLTGLVQYLRRISAAASSEKLLSRSANLFQEALKLYWGGQLSKAVDAVTRLLADDPETDDRFAAYRLWIEALAELNERPALAMLSEHLFLRGQADPDDHETYTALRGMIDLELDAIQAVRLAVKALGEARQNPYVLELIQIYENRIFDIRSPQEVTKLLKSCAPVSDYFHWQTIARGLHLIGQVDDLSSDDRDNVGEALDEVFEHVRETFRGSPLPSLFAFHRYVQSRDFSAATVVAQELVRAYPSHIDIHYYLAYALFEDGNYPASRQVLNKTLSVAGESDPEILSLLGHCNAKLGDAERARHYLKRSSEILRSAGLPHSHTYLELSEVEEDLRKGKPDPRRASSSERAYWLIELSPRRYHDMLTASDEALSRLIRPMGLGAKPGDVAFFGTRAKDAKGGKTWKIIADYTVDSAPMWHPTQRSHSSLRLDSRYETGISVPDLQPLGPGSTKPEQAYYKLHRSYGVFELDEKSFKHIAASLERYLSEHFTERRVDGGRTRTDVG